MRKSLLLAALLATPPAWAESNVCTVISALPYVITTPGAYCLEQSLSLPMVTGAEIGINIDQATDVSLDCNGHQISGTAMPVDAGAEAYTYAGIKVGSAQRVTVRNCRVRGFYRGIVSERQGNDLPRSRDVTIVDNRVSGSLLGIYAIAEGSAIVRDNVVTDVLYTGISTFVPGGQTRISGNTLVRVGNLSQATDQVLLFGAPLRVGAGGGWGIIDDNVIAEPIAPASGPTAVIEFVDSHIGPGFAVFGNTVMAPTLAAEKGSMILPIAGIDGAGCTGNRFVGYGATLPAACANPSNHAY